MTASLQELAAAAGYAWPLQLFGCRALLGKEQSLSARSGRHCLDFVCQKALKASSSEVCVAGVRLDYTWLLCCDLVDLCAATACGASCHTRYHGMSIAVLVSARVCRIRL
jgi:hypothetical protein